MHHLDEKAINVKQANDPYVGWQQTITKWETINRNICEEGEMGARINHHEVSARVQW